MIKKDDIKAMGKSQLMELIHGIGRELGRSIINKTIAEHRKISEKQAKKMKMVSRPEVLKVLDYFGFEML